MNDPFVLTFVAPIVAIWIISALAVGEIAYRKGLQPLGCGILGLFLGPFAVLIAIALPSNQHELDERDVKKGRKQFCPFCREAIQAQAICCPNCLKVLKPKGVKVMEGRVVEVEDREIKAGLPKIQENQIKSRIVRGLRNP